MLHRKKIHGEGLFFQGIVGKWRSCCGTEKHKDKSKGSDWLRLAFGYRFPLNSGAPVACANFISDGTHSSTINNGGSVIQVIQWVGRIQSFSSLILIVWFWQSDLWRSLICILHPLLLVQTSFQMVHTHDGACPTNGGSVIQDQWVGRIQSFSSLILIHPYSMFLEIWSLKITDLHQAFAQQVLPSPVQPIYHWSCFTPWTSPGTFWISFVNLIFRDQHCSAPSIDPTCPVRPRNQWSSYHASGRAGSMGVSWWF